MRLRLLAHLVIIIIMINIDAIIAYMVRISLSFNSLKSFNTIRTFLGNPKNCKKTLKLNFSPYFQIWAGP